jgi:hypothetical protein
MNVRRPCLADPRTALVVAALTICSGAAAQTLTDPYPKTAPPRPTATKSRSTAKACSQYGAGFMQVAGTNTCVKIGGYVTVEGGR